MSFTAQQKTLLAKLMATENLQVQHQKIQTAKFDPKNRVLYLPIWKNMEGFMYDHLTGHEVGHALYTPAEGWHDAVSDKSKGKFFKNFLNVVEDARIEKKIKRKYPGLNSAFKSGFIELINRDFFGIRNQNINGLSFIDRLNIYSKSQWTMDIHFNETESDLIKDVQNCESWEDVVAVANKIFSYSKEEQSELNDTDSSSYYDPENSGEYDYNESNEEFGNEDSEESDSDEETETSDIESESDGNDEDDEDDEEGKSHNLNRFKDSQESNSEEVEPRCLTDESFRENENSLLDATCKEYVYVNVPKANLKNIIVPASRVQEILTKFYSVYLNSEIQNLVSEFKNKNERYVSLLAKEFEMRKAANCYSKNKIADTGDIDIGKLASYKFDDNIFRKMMIVPKGKNHGLILLLDCSGSMMNNMAGSIEQILVLAMFCRKVNIPFAVYGFSDNIRAHYLDLGLDEFNPEHREKFFSMKSFETQTNDLGLGSVYLREYLNSNMSNSDFSKSLRNMIVLKKSYEFNSYSRSKYDRPENEKLSNTPLISAVFAVGQLMPQFRKKFNIDLTSLVIIHDGDSDYVNRYCYMRKTKNYYTNQEEETLGYRSFDAKLMNVILCDSKHKYQYQLVKDPYHDCVLQASLDWFQKTTNSKVFGFFLAENSQLRNAVWNRYRYQNGDSIPQIKKMNRIQNNYDYVDKMKQIVHKIKTDKFVVSYLPGYNEFYLVIGGQNLMTENEELEVNGKVTSSKLKNAFMKMNKKKQISRVLVSRFIQGIAA